MSFLIDVEGYQTRNLWVSRQNGVDYIACEEVVVHPRGASGPCILTIDHAGPHEAVFYDRYREEAV